MPTKEKYWQNPERYRLEQKVRERQNTLNGLKGAVSPIHYLRKLVTSNNWNKRHYELCRAAAKRYRQKIRQLHPNKDLAAYLHGAMRLMRRNNDRKKRLLQLQQMRADLRRLRRTSEDRTSTTHKAKPGRPLDL